jgi:hypothetical protein
MTRTPVLREATAAGALSALLRRSQFSERRPPSTEACKNLPRRPGEGPNCRLPGEHSGNGILTAETAPAFRAPGSCPLAWCSSAAGQGDVRSGAGLVR